MQEVDRLIINASEILTMVNGLGLIKNGAITIHEEKIVAVGPTNEIISQYTGRKTEDATGKTVTPGLIDCHTHLIFAGNREQEFNLRAQGKSYLEILQAGGGILNTVEAVQKASHAELVDHGHKWLNKMTAHGVTTVEIKSGYGLNYDTEKKILEVIQTLKRDSDLTIVSTFLGAHTFPGKYRDNPEAYVDKIINRMLPDFIHLADFCDIFLEKGAFSYEQADRILGKANELGYGIKLHMNQMNSLNGAKLAAKYQASSVDHCDYINDEEIATLAQIKPEKRPVVVLNPGATYFLREKNWAPAHKFINAGLPIAIATDFNPGSCPSPNLPLMMSLACQGYGLTPEQIWPAVTINAARALDLDHEIGSLEIGKKADITIWDMPSYVTLLYHFGEQ